MKKILIISSVFPPEPVTSAMMNYDLATELSKEYSVTVLRPTPTRPLGVVFLDKPYSYDFECITLNSFVFPKHGLYGRFRESISFGRSCKKFIKDHKGEYDIVYNDGWQLFSLYIVAHVCVRFNIPYVVPIQDIYPESLFVNKRIPRLAKFIISSLLKPIDKYYQTHASKVRTISCEMSQYLSKTRGVELSKYLPINNWQSNDEFLDFQYPEKAKSLVFTYVGSLNVHSNVELIIRSYAAASIPNSILKIYGSGPHKEFCEDLVKNMNLTSKVIFDVVSRSEVPKVQSDSGVLVLALHKGNGELALPSKLVSYMMSGRPVLASVDANSATERYIQEARCGICVEPDDAEAMKNGFLYFSTIGYDKLKEYSHNSRKYAEENLMRTPNLTKVIDVISEIILNN